MLRAQGVSERSRVLPRVISCIVSFAVLMTCVFYSFPQAFASFEAESTEQIIGVGRIQSSTTLPSSQLSAATHFEAPEQLAFGSEQAVSQLAQPLERSTEHVESAIANIDLVSRTQTGGIPPRHLRMAPAVPASGLLWAPSLPLPAWMLAAIGITTTC